MLLTTRDWHSIDVAGESFDNDDGTSRQDIIARLKQDDVVLLRREPNNRHDQNAIAVMTAHGQVGFVSRAQAALLAKDMDQGKKIEARVGAIFGGTDDAPSLGLVIDVRAPDAKNAAPDTTSTQRVMLEESAGVVRGLGMGFGGCLGFVAGGIFLLFLLLKSCQAGPPSF